MSPTDATCNHDRKHYLSHFNEAQVNRFFRYVDLLNGLAIDQGWTLRKCFNSTWCAFKLPSNKVAFGVAFRPDGTLYLYAKRIHSEAETYRLPIDRYVERWDQVEYVVVPGSTQFEDFESLLKLAYSRASGRPG